MDIIHSFICISFIPLSSEYLKEQKHDYLRKAVYRIVSQSCKSVYLSAAIRNKKQKTKVLKTLFKIHLCLWKHLGWLDLNLEKWLQL